MPVKVTLDAETEGALAKLQDFFSKSKEGFGEVTKAGEFLRDLGSRLAAAFTVGAIADFTKEAINAAEALKILHSQTGLSLEMLSSLREVSSKTREGFEGITLALTHFSQALGIAIRQGGESARGFRDLIGVEGLAGFASGGKGMDAMLAEVIEAFNKLPEGAQKSELAVEMFGRTGKELLPVLEKMRGELEAGFISPQMVGDSSKFNETVREIKSSLENVFIVLAQKLLPKLQELANWFKGVSAAGTEMSHNLELMAATFAMVFTKALADGMINFVTMVGEVTIDLANELGRKIAESLVSALNSVINWINGQPWFGRFFGTSIQPFRVKSESESLAMAEENKAALRAGMGRVRGSVDSFFNQGIASARDLITQGSSTGGSRGSGGQPGEIFGPPAPAASGGNSITASVTAEALLKDINKAFQEAMAGRKAMLDAEEAEVTKKAKEEILDATKREQALTEIRQTYAKKRTEIDKQQADAQREIDLASIEGKRHVVESDPFKSEMDKKQQMLELLGKERTLLEQNVEILEGRVKADNATPEERLLAAKQLQDTQQKLADNTTDILKTGSKGTLSGEMKTQLKDLKDEFGTVATQIAKTWKDVIGTAISSISGALTGLITGTETWSQALRQIGTSVLNVVIQGIVNMFAAWILGRQAASDVEIATTEAENVGKAIGALFTSITSYGVAAEIGAAALVAALGVGIAAAAGAFAEGGRPEVGGISLVGERGPELMVFDRPGTILPNNDARTQAVLSGGFGASISGAGSVLGARPREIHIHNWINEADLRRHILNHPEADHRIVKVVQQNHHVVVNQG